MTLTLTLSDEQALALKAKADAEGLSSVEEWIEKQAEPIAPNPPVERPLQTAAQIILDSMKDVPPEIMATLPTDGASQHDVEQRKVSNVCWQAPSFGAFTEPGIFSRRAPTLR
jgi:hypothetical protein